MKRNAVGFVIALALVLFASAPVSQTFAQTDCVCGNRKVLLVLAEFPEYQHLSSRAEISRLFTVQVARYFSDVSYGKLTLAGNVTDWIGLPRLYAQYQLPDQQVDLSAVARDAFSDASSSFNFTAYDHVLLVLSFYPSPSSDYVTLPSKIVTRTGPVSAFAVIEEDRDWSVYARSVALLLGLWKNRDRLATLRELDIASSGQGDMTSWSKISLGWINSTQIASFSTPIRRILLLNPIEQAGSQTLAVRINVGTNGAEYLIELRQPIGYDAEGLQEYGAVVLYIPGANSSVQMRAVLQPDDVGRAVFRDLEQDLSIIALNHTERGYWILIGGLQDWREAQRALYAIFRADEAITFAESQNRIEGLDLARRLLETARSLKNIGQFREAEALALSAQTTAESAHIPADYDQAVQLITRAEELKTETAVLGSPQGRALAVLGNDQLEAAKQAFIAKNFTKAKQNAQAAVDLFNRAKQTDLTERILGWLSDIALIIPILVMAYALRYQLKGR